MEVQQNLSLTANRIEQLLEELRGTADPRSFELAEELLRLVSDLYGSGLCRIVEIIGAGSSEALERLVGDELVASLLVVHGLHPESLEERVGRALAKVRPMLTSHAGDVELLEVDPGPAAVRIRLLGTCDGCPSSAVTLKNLVEMAILEAAPEVRVIDVDQPSTAAAASTPSATVAVSLGSKPRFERCPSELAGA